MYYIAQLLHKKLLLVDFVCSVCVFGIFVLSVYVRRTFRVPLISGSSRVFVCRSRCPAGRSAPCRGRCGASGPPGARWWGSRGLSGGGGAQQGGEERAEQKCQAQCVRAGTVALFAPFAGASCWHKTPLKSGGQLQRWF